MCRRVRCESCGKPTWAGCGNHIEEALAGVPRDERCACPRGSVFGALPTKKAG
ncbi:hypothetical protein BE221DRAFT_207201 [Ostreococcus tauri]|uniref:Uncharacterized protein n=1 Tax=Ostreococcus tauri TaxID=70448 RepID=A0A1Y5I5C9_OSTTA|nr:hypothetical protein BE221DRAFT_207201 [Ostreococcus tauri]